MGVVLRASSWVAGMGLAKGPNFGGQEVWGEGNDEYTQPGNLFRLMSADQQLFSNIAAAMEGVPEEIVRRQLGHFHKADPAYAAGVAKAVGVNWQPAA